MKYVIIILFMSFSFDSFAAMISARLVLKNDQKSLVNIGDLTRMQLIVWPATDEDEKLISKNLKEKSFIEGLYIAQIEAIERAPNNFEALVINFGGIFTKEMKPYVLNVESKTILVDLESFQVKGGDYGQEAKLAIVDYGKKSVAIYSIILILVVVLCIIIFKIFQKTLARKKEKELRARIKRKYESSLMLAEERAEIEEIVANISEYVLYLELSKPDADRLCEYVGTIQYKKLWSDTELQSAMTLIKTIRMGR